MEIERKFVPVMVPEEKELAAFPSVKMTQGYLCTDPVVRVRQENDSFVLTYKGAGLLAQVLRMERLVKSLLDLSILEAGDGIRREWVDLRATLDSLASDYQLLAENAGIALHAELPERLTVSGDADKLYRAFSNLLDNALKYNRPEGEIRLAARVSGRQVTVALANTGAVLPENEASRVFEPFYRVDKSRARELGGAGLGLAIVKRIIDLHGGTVAIRPTPDGRTEVRVSLPAA